MEIPKRQMKFELAHPERLLLPVPNMDEPFERKQGYSELPINTSHELFAEPIVPIKTYGIAGQAYYSRPNSATGEAVVGVEEIPYLRRSIAETLAKINESLSDPRIGETFDGEVELYTKDGLRPVWLQRHLYDEVMPRLIRMQNPTMSEDEVLKRRDQLIAKPSSDPNHPSPHATGGAFDVSLVYKGTGENVDMGHPDGDTSQTRPDYFEVNPPISPAEEAAQIHRRAFYNIMTGVAFTEPTGFVVNPTEWWHFGRGDQLSEKVRGSTSAHYSFIE